MTNDMKVLNAICVRPGGMGIQELLNYTELDYNDVETSVNSLAKDGFEVRATSTGVKAHPSIPWIKHVWLSQADPLFHELIQE